MQDRKSPWRWVIIVIVSLIILVIAADELLREVIDRSFQTTFAEIAQGTGVRFPKGSKLLGSSYSSWTDTFIQAKVEMRRADVPDFIASLKGIVTTSDSYTSRLDFIGGHTDIRWWTPDSAHHFKVVSVRSVKPVPVGDFGQRKAYLSFLIDLDDPSKAIVYLDYCYG